MGRRRKARELAVQYLYGQDVKSEWGDAELHVFWEGREASPEVRDFSEKLVRGVLSRLAEIDAVIRRYAENWEFNRIAAVDRNVLRVALYEIFHIDEIPPVVSINEAVDIAKRFSTVDSGKFVNGILDRARKERTP